MPADYGATHDNNIETETFSTLKIGKLRALGVFSLVVLGAVALVHRDDTLFQTEHPLNVVPTSIKANSHTGNVEDCNNGKHDVAEHGVDCGGVCVDRICDCVGDDVVKLADEGKCSWTDNNNTVKPPTAWDNAGEWESLSWTGIAIVSPSAAELEGKVYDEGHHKITFTARDESNNEAFCIAVVNVTDNQAPSMSSGGCPKDMYPELNDECTVPGLNDEYQWTVPGYTDSCGDVTGHNETTTYSETLTGTETISKSYTATDRAGLSATCEFDIAPKDVTSPIVDFTAMDESAVLLDGWTKNSACVKGRHQSTWSSDGTESLSALLQQEVKDNCDSDDELTYTFDPVLPEDGFIPVGENNFTVTIKDRSNNTVTTTVLLIVKDIEDPTFTKCPNDQVFKLPAGEHEMKVEWDESAITARDNDCSSTNMVERENDNELEPTNGAVWSSGNYTVKYVATDASNNTAECSFVMAVIDVTAPVMEGCVESISMNNLLYTHYGIPGYHASDDKWLALTATDVVDTAKNLSTPITWEPNCGQDDCSLDGYAFPNGNTKIVATATDSVGLTTVCEFYVKVKDEQKPFWEDQNSNAECTGEYSTGELDYQQCGGETIVAKNMTYTTKHYDAELTKFEGQSTCCDPSFTCMEINEHFSQCKPSLAPSASPTASPTAEPTNEPTPAPSAEPTALPTTEPTVVTGCSDASDSEIIQNWFGAANSCADAKSKNFCAFLSGNGGLCCQTCGQDTPII